jgi:DNA segregation ATPase FtsK/SpoIIIE-like protein
LTARAAEVVIGAQRCSPSLLQRELGIRFVEAAAVIERLHQRGVVGPHTPSGVREVLVRAGSAGA